MSFLKHLLPGMKTGIEDKRRANAAILAAIDKELTEAEQEALKAKVLMSLETSTGEWLDEYGDIFGVIRLDGEEDEDYRQRIVGYVTLERGTIPAILDAIRNFLQDYETHIEIYEPFNNIFYLNKSKLNGVDHMLGEYYTFAVIDIKISKTFPVSLVDIINEFKPGGVTFRLTYRPGGHNPKAPIVELPLANSEPKTIGTNLSIMSGLNDRIRGHLSLTERTKSSGDTSVFTLNKSKLNSLDVLTGSFSVGNPNYNLASFAYEDFVFTQDATISNVANVTVPMSEDFYTRTGDTSNSYASQMVRGDTPNYLYFTLDLATYFELNYLSYMREIEPSGVYSKATYLSLIDNPYVQHYVKAATPISAPTAYRVQILNVGAGQWEDLTVSSAKYTVTGGKATIQDISKYVNNLGLIFTRIVVDTNHQTTEYPFHVHFFEFGFNKEVAVRPTVQLFDGEVTSQSTVYALGKSYDGGAFKDNSYTKGIDGGTF